MRCQTGLADLTLIFPSFGRVGLRPLLLCKNRGSSQPRDWTQVSRIAGRFFTSWATRGALCENTQDLFNFLPLISNSCPQRDVFPFLGTSISKWSINSCSKSVHYLENSRNYSFWRIRRFLKLHLDLHQCVEFLEQHEISLQLLKDSCKTVCI